MPQVSNSASDKIAEVVELLRKWGPRKRWPWRSRSGAWEILVAELLLVQTNAHKVSLAYEKFLEQFPTPCSVLSATQEELEDLLRPLGLYRQRARRLKEIALYLKEKHNCKVPCSYVELKKVPGVGEYIAAAVSIIACGEPRPILDTNIARVFSRALLGIDPPRRYMYNKTLWQLASGIKWDRDLLFSVIDFASEICTARKPKCGQCPVQPACAYALRS